MKSDFFARYGAVALQIERNPEMEDHSHGLYTVLTPIDKSPVVFGV